MIKKIFLACSFFLLFSMSPLKGEQDLTSSELFSISQLLDSKKMDQKDNLLEIDSFYKETLPGLIGEHFTPEGVYTTAFFANPSHFHPFSNDPFVSSLWELCVGSLAQLKVGQYESMSPFLADSIFEETKENEIHYHITLKKDIYWDAINIKEMGFANGDNLHFGKKPLTSYDFKLYVDVLKNRYVDLPKAVSLRNQYQNLKKVEVTSPTTFTVIWEIEEKKPYSIKYLVGQLKPLPCHIFEYWPDGTSLISNEFDEKSEFVFAKHFCNHWSKQIIPSCGPWIFHKKNQNEIELNRNKDFPNDFAALLDKLIFIYKSSRVSAWQAFKSGELSSCYLNPMDLKDYEHFITNISYQKQKEDKGEIQKLDYFAKLYYFIGWNQNSPLFQSQKVRKALSLAINQKELIDHFLKGEAKPTSGPFLPDSKAYNSSVKPLDYNPKLAIELLEEEGWIQKELGGARQKNTGNKNQMLRFHLAYFLRNEQAQAICQYIAASLKEFGVDCLLQGLDYAEFMNRYQNKNYDAVYMAWSMSSPPENPWPTWHSSEAEKLGSSNIISFKNKEIDQAIEELTFCYDKKRREELYHEIHAKIHDLQPYTFLYVPKQFFVYRSQLKNVFIPKESDLITDGTMSEPCFKIFYIP